LKALTLTQPWATLVAIGAKKIETRSWRTNYRGSLAIHAAKGFDAATQDVCLRQPFCRALAQVLSDPDALHELPRGKIVAVCTLNDCIPMEELQSVKSPERDFGDYSPGRFAWILTNVRALKHPVEARGALGLWALDAGIKLD
jgi:activating signal cointegrator 1